MAESKISVLERALNSKDVVFVRNASLSNSRGEEAWNALTKRGEIPTNTYQMPGVDLFNSLKGYLVEKRAPFGVHGQLPDQYMIRLEGDAGKKAVLEFAERIKAYQAFTSDIHSDDIDKKLADLRNYFNQLAMNQSK